MKRIFFVICLLITMMISAPLWASRTELVVNGTMEADSSWDSYDGPTINERSNTRAYAGTYSRHVVTPGGSKGIKQDIVLTAGKLHKVTARIWQTSDFVYMTIYDGDYNNIAQGSKNTQGSWLEITLFFISGTATNHHVFFLSSGAAEFYVDEVSLIQMEDITGSTVYVASSGNDGDAGTAAAPWATLGAFEKDILGAGYKVYLNRGDSWTNIPANKTLAMTLGSSGGSGNPIIFSSYGTGANPVVKGISTNAKSYIAFNEININGSPTHGFVLTDSEFITLINCSPSNNTIYGVYWNNTATTKSTLTILGGTFTGNVYGIHTSGLNAANRLENLSIQNVTAHSNLGTGIYVSKTNTGRISSNYIYSNGNAVDPAEDYGIAISACNDLIVENNLVDGTINGRQIEVYSDSDAEHGSSNNIAIRKNRFLNGGARSINIGTDGDQTATGMVIAYNFIVGDASYGLLMEHTGAGQAALISVYNNTFAGCLGSAIIATSANFPVSATNNIFFFNGAPELDFSLSSSGLTTSNNLWYRASGNVLSYNGATYTKATISTFEATAVASDPLLDSNYHLTENSPARNAGKPVLTLAQIMAWNLPLIRGKGPDIGAHEFYAYDVNEDALEEPVFCPTNSSSCYVQ